MQSQNTIKNIVDEFIRKVRRAEITDSYQCAVQTWKILKLIVASCNEEDLFKETKYFGKMLINANPLEMSIGNMVRRLLFIINKETGQGSKENKNVEKEKKKSSKQETIKKLNKTKISKTKMNKFLHISPPLRTLRHSKSLSDFLLKTNKTKSASAFNLALLNDKNKNNIKNEIQKSMIDVEEELKFTHDAISEQGIDLIHANEIILTFGYSKMALELFQEVYKTRKFEVVVAESSPNYSGHKMAVALSKLKIPTTLINDSAIFSIMSKVNSVIVGTRFVMANGGLITDIGFHNLAIAANVHSLPFIVLFGNYQLSPFFPYDQDTFNIMRSPDEIFEQSEMTNLSEKVHIINPQFDYVPPNLITLFINNENGQQPSYIYRIVQDQYSTQDFVEKD
ncbi:translation initiation factor eif-2b subunit beta [Anaeramoeba flamelloides]|uniref:Translation initiation factor eIF2B subunit beta n=1 Tax=Anaeramoeba flamelloides TaxID=1746091 RepID=A0AAV8A878_9EUKA|nr:translation initiation factor eif-2b subunit beta [Anaeramoeba flamelloides]